MKNTIENTIQRYEMFPPDSKIAVAFSGGADSTALLHFFHEKGMQVSAIHVNHMIRGKEADRDEEFCRSFCKKREIPFFCRRVNVPVEAEKTGEGMEEAARRLRYEAIESTVKAESIDRVATAHHSDDNAETVIFNIIRGSGTRGGCGIPPVRGIYIRPLINCTRDEILEYCKEHSLEYVTDSTNLSAEYTRNYIRHDIMPLLKKLNPRFQASIGSFAFLLRQDDNALCNMADCLENDREKLSAQPNAVLSRYIRRFCNPGSKTIASFMRAIRSGNDYIRMDMGDGIVGVCDRNSVFFRQKTADGKIKSRALAEGENHFPEFGTIYIGKENIYNLSINISINSDRIKGNLYIRSRQNGDKYRYGGMTRSLKKLFNSKSIPVEQRNRIPVICDDEGIVWIPGFPPRDNVRVAEKENSLYIGVEYDTQ